MATKESAPAPISKDGIELKVGMRVVHFLDKSFDNAGEILFIDGPHSHSNNTPPYTVLFRDSFGSASNYWPQLLCASPRGLLQSQLEEAEASIPRLEEMIREQREICNKLRRQLAP